MLDDNRIKERLSLFHLQAVAAEVNCVCEEVSVDVDSVDATIVHHGKFNESDRFRRPKLDVQLKATTQWEWKNGLCAFNLEIKNYDELRDRSMNPAILIAYLMPKDRNKWVEHCEEHLLTRHCAYWHNLCGYPEVNNSSKRTIHIQRSNVLSPAVLIEMLRRIARGEELGNVL